MAKTTKRFTEEEIANATWKLSPQTVRFFKSKVQARAILTMRKAINRGREKNAKIMKALEHDMRIEQQEAASYSATVALMTRDQVEAVKTVQAMTEQIAKFAYLINEQNIAFDLRLPPLILSELTAHIETVDARIGAAKFAAQKMNAKPVVGHIRGSHSI